MTAEELCQRFGISRNTLYGYRRRFPTFPPIVGATRNARYTRAHVEWIGAHLALRHNSVSTTAATAYCLDAGITLAQYVHLREQSIRDFGIGVA